MFRETRFWTGRWKRRSSRCVWDRLRRVTDGGRFRSMLGVVPGMSAGRMAPRLLGAARELNGTAVHNRPRQNPVARRSIRCSVVTSGPTPIRAISVYSSDSNTFDFARRTWPRGNMSNSRSRERRAVRLDGGSLQDLRVR